MPALAMRTYNTITPEKWLGIQNAAARYGINIEERSGQAQTYGADIRWRFTGAQTLVLEVWQSSLLAVDQLLNMMDRMVEEA